MKTHFVFAILFTLLIITQVSATTFIGFNENVSFSTFKTYAMPSSIGYFV